MSKGTGAGSGTDAGLWATDAAGWHTRWEKGAIQALYLHIPFCKHKCAYCDFASYETPTGDSRMRAYTDTLISWMENLSRAGMLSDVRTAYIGGGTPSMLGEDLPRLVAAVAKACPELFEFSCEANPESLDGSLCLQLKDAGLTRISLGVQSTNDAELSYLGRIHSARRALAALEEAVASGLSVSCDLMCAIPLQTQESWEKSIADVLACGVQHVSVYPLQVEEGTLFHRLCESGAMAWPDADSAADRMVAARELLCAQGFAPYEVASYAREGHACLHNLSYWSGIPYLGLGTGAASMLSLQEYAKLQELLPSLDAAPSDCTRVRLNMQDLPRAIAQGIPLASTQPETEFLDLREAVSEDLMLAARTQAGISSALFQAAREVLGAPLDTAVDKLLSRGLLARNDRGAYTPTQQGWLLGNELYGELWDLAQA